MKLVFKDIKSSEQFTEEDLTKEEDEEKPWWEEAGLSEDPIKHTSGSSNSQRRQC